ncbi:Nucleoporin nup84 [Kickxella alabastrina]|uniref:Nucleoporin nup84 n=1 Tax=Kickxella alabastrina TaxID=61397 RepID=A0ACC1I830_9FUNG|nr:Nucleoporin nup84 [Kickxella alabastrina]
MLDITTEFAAVVDSRDEYTHNGGGSHKSNTSQARLFSQLAKQRHEEITSDAFTVDDSYKKNEASYWNSESNTWDLLERLYALRAQVPADEDSEDSVMREDNDSDEHRVPEKPSSITATAFSSVQELMTANSQLSEYVEVRRWLEENAPPFQPVETRKGYLFYTRRNIKERERLAGSSEKAAAIVGRIVTEADPDSTSRQRKELAFEDAEYECGLLRTLFEYVRRGRADNAMDLCIESDEPWRAASLKGGLFWRDPKLEADSEMPVDGGDATDIDVRPPHPAGNINRTLWKQACAALAQDDNNELYERALYAALSGRLDEVLLVSGSWEDHVWAYINTMVEAQIDQGIKDASVLYTPAQNTSLGHVQSKHPPVSDIKQVFDSLATHESASLRSEAGEPFHALQMAIITNTFQDYVIEFARKLSAQELSDDESDLLRVVIHSALYLRSLGFNIPSDAVDVLLGEYIGHLTTDRRELVASYVSHLPARKQTEAYAQFLQTVSDAIPVRMNLLRIGEKQGLDADAIAKRTSELVLLKYASTASSTMSGETEFALAEPAEPITDEELDQVRAIEWITSSPQLYEHALVETSRLVRQFLLAGRTNAATQLLNSLPDDFVQQDWLKGVRDPASPATGGSENSNAVSASSDPFADLSGSHRGQSAEIVSHVHEYIHLLSLCDAYAHYSTWAETLCKQPVDTGRLGSRVQTQWLEWRDTIVASTERAIHMFRTQLLEVDWLSTQTLRIDVDSLEIISDELAQRLNDLARLREIYIPETVFRLHSILFDTRDAVPQNLKHSLDLAQLVADESLGIYRQLAKASPAHPRGRLAAFMGLMRRSAFETLCIQQEMQADKPPLLAGPSSSISGGLV